MSRLSQVDQLKAWFDSGQSLTVLEALQRFGVMALSQRCTDLRREGYPVISGWQQLLNGKMVKRYWKATEEPKPIPKDAQMSISL